MASINTWQYQIDHGLTGTGIIKCKTKCVFLLTMYMLSFIEYMSAKSGQRSSYANGTFMHHEID